MSSVESSTGPTYADADVLLSTLDEVVDTLEANEIRYLVIGGIATTVWGRNRWTRDIDIFVRPEDRDHVMELLAERGIETRDEYPHWLSKATKGELTADVISRSTRDILLDDLMWERRACRSFEGRELPLVPAEDLLVMKAIATVEDTPRYWYDALSIIGHAELDWEYLLLRARQHGPRRILSLLLYAQSDDLLVPAWVVDDLYAALRDDTRPSDVRPIKAASDA
jgi:hypothetical protein